MTETLPHSPRPLTQIHQIELTSRCNLACQYCIHGSMLRLRRDMEWETFDRALAWVRYFCERGTQGELNLAGVGESFLHPRFAEMVARAREVLGPGRRIILATNGLAVTPPIVDAVRPYNPRIVVSLHRPERAAEGLRLLKEAGLLEGISTDPVTNPNDWAGQVAWPPGRRGPQMSCPWLQLGWGFVVSTGQILTCCLDGSCDSAVSDVGEQPHSPLLTPWRLCPSCYQVP